VKLHFFIFLFIIIIIFIFLLVCLFVLGQLDAAKVTSLEEHVVKGRAYHLPRSVQRRTGQLATNRHVADRQACSCVRSM
jgi:hypothetical protein